MAIHTLAWFSIEACVVYVLYSGFARRSDSRAGVAAGVVATESLIFAGARLPLPLTRLAERLGAERGSVTDIYLPRWFARNLPGHPRPPDRPGRDSSTPETFGPGTDPAGPVPEASTHFRGGARPGRVDGDNG